MVDTAPPGGAGRLYWVRASRRRDRPARALAGPGQRFAPPLVTGDAVYLSSCFHTAAPSFNEGPGQIEAFTIVHRTRRIAAATEWEVGVRLQVGIPVRTSPVGRDRTRVRRYRIAAARVRSHGHCSCSRAHAAPSGQDRDACPPPSTPLHSCSRACARRAAACGTKARVPTPRPRPRGSALAVFASRRVRGVSPVVADSLLAWSRGERPVDLVFEVLSPREVLRRQAVGRRCVALLDDAVARAHGDPRHPDGLSFALHDLHHFEKFVEPEHHLGQVGFFRAVDRALASTAVAALELTFDATWSVERDYVLADMNGSAVFLFSVLKMRLAMAVRRRLASATGRPVPTTGRLDDNERAALQPVLSAWFAGMGLPAALRTEAFAVTARRDHPAQARRLLDHFEAQAGAHFSATECRK